MEKDAKMRIAVVLTLILIAFLTGVSAFAEQGFYYEAYLSANPDLPQDWGLEECMSHYKLFGFSENRALTFNLDEYLNANPDLPGNWSFAEALSHYNTCGKLENRLLAFEAVEYLSLYPDLPQDWSYDQAYAHYVSFGSNEGRIASFDESAYLELYDDLPISWGQDEAFYHYIHFGQYEGRVYDPYDEDVFVNDFADSGSSDSLFLSAFEMNEVDTPPRVIQSLPPSYPFFAIINQIEGRVVLEFVVDVDGKAKEIEILVAEPEGVFEEVSIYALERYQFTPAVKDGEYVPCIVKLPISFTLE
jgi:TonB family protein